MSASLTLNKITAQKGIGITEAANRVADLGWTPSYVQEAMTFPTDYKISKVARDPMKQVLRSYFPMQEEKDNRVYGALDAALRGDMFRNVEPRWVEWMKLFLAIIPTFHSLQYLAVVWRYQLNAGAKSNGSSGSFLSGFWPTGVLPNLAMFIGIGTFLGFLGFMGLPRFLDAIFPYDKHLYGPSLFVFAFYIFINVHHYFLDNVMWRRGNPDVVQHIFSR